MPIEKTPTDWERGKKNESKDGIDVCIFVQEINYKLNNMRRCVRTGGGVDELAVDEELGELDLRHHQAPRRRTLLSIAALFVAPHR